ncbi:hypothetical protein M0R04_09050 [Candidatus Dojkabacteria bacterium]|jgi:hypothetical protein|nr:hypothetical protein [Candidatus Dojkabacteria bacterium]
MSSTIQIEDKQLKRLMMDKVKYRKSYYEIIEGYQRLIDKLRLRPDLDIVMEEMSKKEDTKE